MNGLCSSGKTRHQSQRKAKAAAHVYSRQRNREGELTSNLYTYRCGECHAWHLTRRPSWNGAANIPVFTAPPESLQRWAIGETALKPTALERCSQCGVSYDPIAAPPEGGAYGMCRSCLHDALRSGWAPDDD